MASDETVPFLSESKARSCSQVEEPSKSEMTGIRRSLCSVRFWIAYMALFGFFNVYAMRVNLSVAIVSMVRDLNDTNTADTECPVLEPNRTSNATTPPTGEFNWDKALQGYVLSSFFYGYILTQVPGGWLATRFGAKYVYGFGVLTTTVFTLLTPVLVRWNVYVFIVARVLEGFGEGVTYPAMHALMGCWAPPLERSKMMALIYSGAHLGTMVCSPLSGLICATIGWEYVFYVFGGLGLVWFAVWMLVVSDKPTDHKWISTEEKDYILHALHAEGTHASQNAAVPWRQIFTSLRVWAIIVAHVCNNWGFYCLLLCLPSYLKYVLRFDIKDDGLLSGLPYMCLWFVLILSGFVADYLRDHEYLSTTAVRKIANSIGQLTPAIFLIAIGYVGCDTQLAIMCLVIAIGMNAPANVGYNINHIDIAPKFAGVLLGITNGLATIPGIVGPIVIGLLTNHHETRAEWRLIFQVTAGIYVFGALFYAFFGSGKKEWWADGVNNYEPLVGVVEPEDSS